MGPKFIMNSSKSSFAEVPTPLAHHVSARDKTAQVSFCKAYGSQLKHCHKTGGKGPKPDAWEEQGGGWGGRNQNTTTPQTNLPSILLEVTFEANKILPLLSFNQNEKEESEIWG